MAVNEYLKRVYGGSARSYFERAEKALLRGERLFTVTANPEIIMHADRDPKIKKLLLSPDAEIIPDGISVVKAMNTLGCEASERITGVDLAAHLLKAAGENGKSVYLLGAKEEVVSALAEKLRAEHPDITVNYHNGYDGDKDVIFDEIAALAPDLVLVGFNIIVPEPPQPLGLLGNAVEPLGVGLHKELGSALLAAAEHVEGAAYAHQHSPCELRQVTVY